MKKVWIFHWSNLYSWCHIWLRKTYLSSQGRTWARVIKRWSYSVEDSMVCACADIHGCFYLGGGGGTGLASCMLQMVQRWVILPVFVRTYFRQNLQRVYTSPPNASDLSFDTLRCVPSSAVEVFANIFCHFSFICPDPQLCTAAGARTSKLFGNISRSVATAVSDLGLARPPSTHPTFVTCARWKRN